MKKQPTNQTPRIFGLSGVGGRTKIGGRLQALFQSLILLTLLTQGTAAVRAATGELTFIEATSLSNAGRVVVSPDGKNLYAASTDKYNWGILSVYSRDETTGKLTLIDSETKHEDTNIGRKQAGQGSLAVSPDGNYVYMGMLTGQCVLSFRRDPSTGALDFIAIADSKFGYNGSQNINSLEISQDGEYLYTTGAGRVGVYDVDLSTGLLTEIQGIQDRAIMLATNRSRISPDGRHHYVSDINGNAIVVWDRDDSTGLLSNDRRFENGTGGALIDGPTDIRFSPDGDFLYVGVVRSDDSVTVLKRDSVTGDLAYSSTVAYGADRNPRNLFLSPGGDVLLASLQTGKRLSSYSVDNSNGALGLVDEELNGVDGNKLDRPSGVTISPDGQFAYASSYRDGYINVYALDSTIAAPAIEKIFWVETDRVGSINKDGSGDIETVASGLELGYSIEVDQDGGKVYWADRVASKISRSNLDGTDVEDLYVFNASTRPFSLALDVAAGDLYFASPDSKTIERGKMDGSAAPVVIYDANDASAAPDATSNPGIRDVRGIALDVDAGMIYWTDRGAGDDRVVRGTMDGTMTPQLLYIQVSGSAQDIALDIDAGMLYWANSGRSQIERAKMDGSGDRITVYSGTGTGGSPTGIALDIEAGDIYWSANNDDSIRRGKLDGQTAPDSTPVVLVSGLNNPNNIALATTSGSGNSGGGGDPVDEAPVITLLGDSPIELECGTAFNDPGATANDDLDGDISASIIVDTSSVNTNQTGSYVVTYDVTDSGGNGAEQMTRTVVVVDTTAPTIVLNGSAALTIECGFGSYQELGAVATDACDPNVTVIIGGDVVNTTSLGTYTVTYDAVDASGNVAAQVVRAVTVVDTTAPVITLNGDAAITLECSIDSYSEQGAVAADACDPSVTVTIGGDAVDASELGTYTVTYDAVDASGNVAAQVVRTVSVVDTTAPVITLLGDSLVVLECHNDTYAEDGASVFDACDGGVQVVVAGSVDTDAPGTYLITYDAVDGSGNEADQVVRTVVVEDTIAPVVAIIGSSDIVLLQHDVYVEEGATVADECDANVTVVTDNSTVDTSSIGVFTVTYDAVDASGNNSITQLRTVTVLPRFAALDALFGCAELKLEEDAIVDGTIGGMSSIQLHKKSLVTGDVFNVLGDVQLHQKAQVAGTVDAGGKVTLHKDASSGAIVSGQRVDLKKNAQVSGDVASAADVKLAKGASVGGVINENQSVTPMAEIQLPVLNLVAGGSDVRVSKNDSILLAPGVYQALEAKRNSTVELVSGHYSFSEFKVERGSVLQLDLTDGPVIVDVVGELKMEGVEMSVLNGGAQDVLFQVQGDQAKLGTDEEDDEVFGAYIGTYLVANGQFMLEPGATLIGAGYARSVMVKENGLVQSEPAIDLIVVAAAQWGGMTSCYEVVEGDGDDSESDENDSDDDEEENDDDEGEEDDRAKGKGKGRN